MYDSSVIRVSEKVVIKLHSLCKPLENGWIRNGKVDKWFRNGRCRDLHNSENI